jgi:potassium/chloride transporter 9
LTFTFVVYVMFFFFSAATCSRRLLVHNYGYLQEINQVPQLVMVGVFSATLSAALSCLIGASRILQAISRDNLLGDFFLVFSKEKKEPVRAVLLSWALVQLVLVIKTITTIAPIVAMLFLLSYAITNFACFFLTISGTVNFRPRFRLFSWHTALAGGLSCIIIMFVVEPSYVFPAHPYVLRICAQTVLSSLIRALPVPAKSDMRR